MSAVGGDVTDVDSLLDRCGDYLSTVGWDHRLAEQIIKTNPTLLAHAATFFNLRTRSSSR